MAALGFTVTATKTGSEPPPSCDHALYRYILRPQAVNIPPFFNDLKTALKSVKHIC